MSEQLDKKSILEMSMGATWSGWTMRWERSSTTSWT